MKSPQQEYVNVAKIIRDEQINTRPVNDSWVRQHQAVYNHEALGVITVSRRADGSCVAVDGQNRVALVKLVHDHDVEILCNVYEGLTLREEAQLFLQLNDSRKVTPLYEFKARATAEDPNVLAMLNILKYHGWRVGNANKGAYVSAVNAVEKVFNTTGGAHVLSQTMQIITKAWGHDKTAVKAPIILGIGQVMAHYGGTIDPDMIGGRLALFPGGANGMIGRAHAITTAGLSNGISTIVIEQYNYRKSAKNRLPSWENRLALPNVNRGVYYPGRES